MVSVVREVRRIGKEEPADTPAIGALQQRCATKDLYPATYLLPGRSSNRGSRARPGNQYRSGDALQRVCTRQFLGLLFEAIPEHLFTDDFQGKVALRRCPAIIGYRDRNNVGIDRRRIADADIAGQ